MTTITCYGGVGEIGGNKLRLDADGTSLFLDFGFSFGAEGQYFEEYLQPRSGSKLHDLLDLGLVPALDGIYRRDALRPAGLDDLDGNPATPLWNVDVLRDVRPAAVQRYRADLLSGATTHHQLLFEAISQLVTENGDEIRSGMVYERYTDLCESTGRDGLSTRRISEYITDLELLDIIDVDTYAGGKFGRTRTIRLKQYL